MPEDRIPTETPASTQSETSENTTTGTKGTTPPALNLTQEQLNSMFAKNRKGLTTLVETQKNEIAELKGTVTEFMENMTPTLTQLTEFMKTKPTTTPIEPQVVDKKNVPPTPDFSQQTEQFQTQMTAVNQQLEDMKKANLSLQKEIETAKNMSAAEKRAAQKSARDAELAAVLGPVAVDPSLLLPYFQEQLTYNKEKNVWEYVDKETDIAMSVKDYVLKNLPATQRKAVTPPPGPGGNPTKETTLGSATTTQLDAEIKQLRERHLQNPLDAGLIAKIGSKTRELAKVTLAGQT